jgi:hypothetical protein
MYTMRSKHNPKDHSSVPPLTMQKLGPGQYQTETFNSVANFRQVVDKYSNAKNTTIGRDKRFKDKMHITPGPGPTIRKCLSI